jgi:hypothetical protein
MTEDAACNADTACVSVSLRNRPGAKTLLRDRGKDIAQSHQYSTGSAGDRTLEQVFHMSAVLHAEPGKTSAPAQGDTKPCARVFNGRKVSLRIRG